MEGLFVFGQNPAVGGRIRGSSGARWRISTGSSSATWSRSRRASFWYDSPEVERGELRTEDNQDGSVPDAGGGPRGEGGLLHQHAAAAAVAREGRRSAGRCAQRYAWFIFHLGRRLKEKAARDPRPRNAGPERADVELSDRSTARRAGSSKTSCRRSTAGAIADGTLVSGFRDLKADGSTACGCWIYSGVYPEPGATARTNASRTTTSAMAGDSRGRPIAASCTTARRRAPTARRGASARSWSGGTRASVSGPGCDVPDFTVDEGAGLSAAARRRRRRRAERRRAVHHAPGRRRRGCGCRSAFATARCPTYYEPLESPVGNALYPEQPTNPPADRKERPDNPLRAARRCSAFHTC